MKDDACTALECGPGGCKLPDSECGMGGMGAVRECLLTAGQHWFSNPRRRQSQPESFLTSTCAAQPPPFWSIWSGVGLENWPF